MKVKLFWTVSVLLIMILVFSIAATASAKTELFGSEKANNHAALANPRLEKMVFIHYKKGFAKPSQPGKGKVADKGYAFLGNGVKWKQLPVNYVINPDNPSGLTTEFIANAIYQGTEEWDTHTGTKLFGTFSIDSNASWDNDTPDGRNELVFADYPKGGVIAATVVWGYLSGPPSTREISEFDVLFDTDFIWGDAILGPTVMDLQNAATHEIGHGLGLADVYGSVYAEETMYGYSDYGEIKKRDLNTGDITGIQMLYGP